MKWSGRRMSDNVDDRRGKGGGMVVGGGILTVVIAIIVYFMGGDPSQLLNSNTGTTQNNQHVISQEEQQLADFVKVVLADTEDVWSQIFSEMNRSYQAPTMVLFTGNVQSACGGASSASGPFYCPADEKLYIDLSFYQELKDRFQAPGDFAMAYVVAHEVGHHVQNLLGTSRKVQELRQQLSETDYNKLSVRLELQADFYAGLWAHYDQKMKDVLEPGDIDEALTAANAIGDDRLQKESQGYVVPDAFTHGTSEQRMYWFKKGYETGDIRQGDTFNNNR
ncbi:metalloprotease [Chitinophaga caeni]|uniref:Metalloprotease n=1 Tax=Chitinophaga caeni TaxID=2029983 RepID=A0A291QRM6_9BACT|nr:neutral zinc metallopeptidase [Chitinophaga caeni]ATL46648.1 metalloprotease [Chitinophaga caeni]